MKNKIVLGITIIIILCSIVSAKFETKEHYKKNQVTLEHNKDKANRKINAKEKAKQSKKNNDKKVLSTQSLNVKNKKSKQQHVYLTIDFSTFKNKAHYKLLKPQYRKWVKNIYVLYNAPIKYYKNDTAFKILQRGVKKYGIQMEYQGASANIYNSVYIRGLNNIYEFHAGSESGWMYSVNGVFPNYGMSNYKIKPNSKIRMAYTVNLGCDLGSGVTC